LVRGRVWDLQSAARISALPRFASPTIFLIALPLLWLRFGHWFYLSLDEGIYLAGARRVADGQVPYRDFFNITGPGSFWLYSTVFRVFGITFAAARAVLCLELAALCAISCWLVSRVAGAAIGIASSLLLLAMLLTTSYPVYVTHRWDSQVAALAALACVVTGGKRWFAIGGVLAGCAAWITPPMVLVSVPLALYCGPGRRWFLAGAGIPTVAAISVLIYQGAFTGMVQSLIWDAANYAAANRLPYGALAGTWESFRRQGSVGTALVRYADSVLPVLLPPLAAIAILAFKQSRALLGAVALAALLACLPRVGAAQLLFASAFFWTICWCGAGNLLPGRSQRWVATGVLLVALLAGFAGWPRSDLRRIDTPVGTLAVSRLHFVILNDLLSTIRPGENVFVYPYLPALYFVLGAQNPTRYAWLQPGMMGSREVQSAIADLRAKPPHRVIWHDLSEAFVLKNWPSSDRTRLRFPEMETFLQANYHVINPDGVIPTGFRLLEKNP
jgi:hypothetical protein